MEYIEVQTTSFIIKSVVENRQITICSDYNFLEFSASARLGAAVGFEQV